MKILSHLLLFVVLLFFSDAIRAQQDAAGFHKARGPKEHAEAAIADLKNGVLVIRLKTGNAQLQALRRVADSPHVSEKIRKKFEKKIVEKTRKIKEENEWLRESLKEEYDFSEILYIADTSAHLLKEGISSGYFLNENNRPDTSLSLHGRPYLVAFYGDSASPAKNGVEGLVVLDKNFKELSEPFPHFIGVSTTRKLFGRFFNKKADIEFFKLMARRFNEKLKKYWETVRIEN